MIFCAAKWFIEFVRWDHDRVVLRSACTFFVGVLSLVTLCVFVGCSSDPPPETLTLATTTSTRDSGLMDEILPLFEKQTGIDVKMIAVGTGQALAIARRGDADVVLSHAPAAEQEFVDEGFAKKRTFVMFNDFVLVGPEDDPAKIQGTKSISEAFAAIAKSEATFGSRADESGTHVKEKAIWQDAEIEPKGKWYLEVGAGMGSTLRVSFEKQAYTLSDRATYLAHNNKLHLKIMSEGDQRLRNDYAVMVVSRDKHAHIKHELATKFAEFLLSDECQKKIAEYGIESYGQPLFFPAKYSSTLPLGEG